MRAVYKDCSLEFKFPHPPSKHKLNKSLGEVSKPGHFFQASLSNSSSFSLPLAQSRRDRLLLMVTAGSMSKSGSSYEWKYLVITNLRTGRKGKKQENPTTSELQLSLARNTTQNAFKALHVYQSLLKQAGNRRSPGSTACVSINMKSGAIPWADSICSWSPEFQASTGEIYNAALTASSLRGGFPLALCRKHSKQFHWKAPLKHIYISKLSLIKSSLSQSTRAFPSPPKLNSIWLKSNGLSSFFPNCSSKVTLCPGWLHEVGFLLLRFRELEAGLWANFPKEVHYTNSYYIIYHLFAQLF